jgi:hypothetical protein
LKRAQEATQTLVRLFQRFDFEVDPGMAGEGGGMPQLRPGITLGFRDGLWLKVRERV